MPSVPEASACKDPNASEAITNAGVKDSLISTFLSKFALHALLNDDAD
jgi:hypothetical protein